MKNTPKILKRILFVLIGIVLFVSGIAVGIKYHDFDILCSNNPRAAVLNKEFISENGIIIPKGTIIPLQECEYADRFILKFYLTHLPENIDVFSIYEPTTEKDKLNSERRNIFQHGLEVNQKN